VSRPEERGEYSAGYWQGRVRREALALCRDAKGRLLEVGCGEGLFLAQVSEGNRGIEIFGIDNDEARLMAAANRLRNANLSVQDAGNLSFEDDYFDTVVCINVLFNMGSMEEVRRTLGEMRRVCKKDGSIIFDFRNSENPLSSVKYRLAKYYDDTIRNLPLRTYSTRDIEGILRDLGMAIADRKNISSIFPFPAAVIVVKANKP
jgi:ubiquinone/menaquinone biosynthesis C-methylase UbiE